MKRKIHKQIVTRKRQHDLPVRRTQTDERGSALPIIMLLSLVLLGMAALAVDIMYAYVASTQAQTAANAAALAGASKLPVNDIQSAKALAVEYAAKNVIIGESVSLDPDTDIQFGAYDPSTETFTITESNPDTIRVFVRRTQATGNPLKMFFAHVLGFGAIDISNSAAATIPNKYVMLTLDRSGSMGYDTAEYSGSSLYWRVADKWYSKSSGSYQLAAGDYYSQELGQFSIQPGNPYGTCVSEKQGTFPVQYAGSGKYDLPVSKAGQKVARPTVPSPGGWTYYASTSTWYSEYLGDFFTIPNNGYQWHKWQYTPGHVYAWSGNREYVRSMEEPIQPFTDVLNAAKTFVDRLSLTEDKTGVVSFGTEATLNLTLSQEYDSIMQHIDSLEAGGHTNTPDAIDLAVQELTSERAAGFSQRVIILVSDGRPRAANVSQSVMRQATLDAAAVAAEKGILIYAVTVGHTSEVDVGLMKEIANMTGGAQYHTANSEDLSAIFNEIFERIPPRLVGIVEEDISAGTGGGDGQSPPPPTGGSGDVDGSISPDFYDTEICYGTTDPSTGETTQWAKMYVNATSDPDYIYAALEFDKAFADNTYGANSSGYYKQDKKTGELTPKAHNFKDLVGSDRTLFQVTDGNGNLVLEFYVDYISADTQAASGYSSLGVWGGDGSMVSGDPSYIVEANTSLSWDLVHYPSMIVDSPATDASYTQNPSYPDWIYEVAYEVKIAKAAFGTAGFGSISIPYVHASPSKLGFNTLDVEIVDCPPSGGASSTPPPDTSPQYCDSYTTSGYAVFATRSIDNATSTVLNGGDNQWYTGKMGSQGDISLAGAIQASEIHAGGNITINGATSAEVYPNDSSLGEIGYATPSIGSVLDTASDLEITSSQTISPGIYRDIVISGTSTVYMEPGKYFVRKIEIFNSGDNSNDDGNGDAVDWYNASWAHRRSVTVSPATSADDYQVLVTLTTATMGNPYTHVNSDGSDIRFTGPDGTTLQDYWIESWDNTGVSKIWVEVKTSGTSQIYMYYGNTSASAASDGGATFLFFDGFDRADSSDLNLSLGGDKWDEYTSGSADAEVKSSALRFTPWDGVKDTIVVSKPFAALSGMFRWKFNIDWHRNAPGAKKKEKSYWLYMQLGNYADLDNRQGKAELPAEKGKNDSPSSHTGTGVDLVWYKGKKNPNKPPHETLSCYDNGHVQENVAQISGSHTIEITGDVSAGTYDVNVDGGSVEKTNAGMNETTILNAMRFIAHGINSEFVPTPRDFGYTFITGYTEPDPTTSVEGEESNGGDGADNDAGGNNPGYVELRPAEGSTGTVELYVSEKFRAIGAVRINYTGLQYADGDRFIAYLAKVDHDVPTVAPTHGVPLADDSDYGFAFHGSLSMHGAIYGPQTNIYIRGSYRNDSGALVGKNIFTDDSLWLTYNEPDTFNPCDEPDGSSNGGTPPSEGGGGDTGGSTPPSGGSGSTPPSSGGGDVDGSISPDFYDTTICYGTVDQTTGQTTEWAKMYVNATSDPDYIYAALEFDKAFADNTYGANSSGYYKKNKKTGELMPRAHNFDDLVGSDRTLFQVTDGNGNLVLEFYVDYISADIQAASGYSSLGIWGGDGSMVAGDPTYIAAASTSLSWNLTHYSSMIVDSPATDADYTPNPNYPDWIYEVAYEVKIAKAAFGTTGFGNISIPYVHASPSKLGFNTLDVQIIDCPPSDGGSGTPPPSSGGGSGDVDGSISPDFYDTVICYGTVDQSTNQTTKWARMFVNATSDPDYIYAALEFDKAFADNTYGANSSGYYKKDKKTGQLTPKTHDFNALVGSDRTLFQVTDGNSNLVLEFYVDYISADIQAASGYSSLGIWGGDGSMVAGDPTYIAAASTSLSWNLTHYPSMIVDSPATDADYTPNQNYPDWIYEVAYEVKIAKAAFGTAGFGSISIPYVHASPSKLGFNTLDVQIVDCVSSSPPGSSSGGSSAGGSPPPPDADAEFTVYNLDVKVGDTFKLSDYVKRTPATLGIGTDIAFYYKNGTTPVADWHLDDFNNDNSITIVGKDRNGHSVGQKKGKYRVHMAIAGQDGPADHITIRVKKK